MATSDLHGDRWTDRLSDYLDGGLEPAEREALESHLQTCAVCATTLDDLREVVARSKTLENPASPAELWAGIVARIEDEEAARKAPVDIRSHRRFIDRRFSISLPQALAAGLALVFLSGAGVWLALRGPGVTPAPGGGTSPIASRTLAPGSGANTTFDPQRPDGAAGDPSVASRAVSGTAGDESGSRPDPSRTALAAFSDPRYDATIAQLQEILTNGRDQLDTTTVRVLEQNLAIIDRAVEEARRAVAADPANPYLRTHLASTMRRKVDLLRRATVIVGAQG